jgi:TolB-like protein/DNA-binding winged helix-turn-helix (wHTH) protein/Tfp pilus assembly protein PilF
MDTPTSQRVKFGRFEFNPATGELKKAGVAVKLQAQPAKVLGLLIRRAGELVTRQELQQEVWGENFVEFDQGLNFCIRQIRIALNEQAEAPLFIETVPRQGYRFIAPLSPLNETPAEPAPAAPALAPAAEPAMPPVKRWRGASVLIGMAVLVAGLALAVWLWRRPVAQMPGGRRMLAVLPFDNFTGETAQEHFCDGLTEELIAVLSRLNPAQLGVIARTSAMRYKTDKKPVSQIKTELGVDFLIEGSVRQQAGQARITVQLIRASDASHLWALSFDRAQSDLLGVQREVAEAVARSLTLELLPARPAPPESANPLARAAYLKGRYQLAKRDGAALTQAQAFFQQALAADPRYAAALAGLAEAQFRQALPPREKRAQVRASLQRALELDETLAEAHCLSGSVAQRLELDWPLARQEFERALALDPGRAQTHHEFAFYFSDLGLHDEAITRLQKTLELDPVSPLVQGDLGWLFLRAGRYDEAVRQCLKTLELEPADIGAHFCLLHTYQRQGHTAAALAQGREVMRLAGAKPAELAALENGGLPAYRRWELNMLLARGQRGYLDPAVLAMTYADLGEHEQALQALLQADREGSGYLSALRAEPRYDPLRADPRFRALHERLFPR